MGGLACKSSFVHRSGLYSIFAFLVHGFKKKGLFFFSLMDSAFLPSPPRRPLLLVSATVNGENVVLIHGVLVVNTASIYDVI